MVDWTRMVFVDSHRGHNCADTWLVLTALLTSVVKGLRVSET